MSASRLAKVAREDVATGQYVVVAEAATVTASDTTLTVRHQQTTLLHQPLSALLFAATGSKLMIVPTSRAAAHVVEFHVEREACALVEGLRSRGVVIHGPPAPPPKPSRPSPALLSRELEQLATSDDFRDLLADVEGALARRQSLGLPDLLGQA